MRGKAISLKHILLLLLCSIFWRPVFSQNIQKVPLEQILKMVETQFDVRFSYAPGAIKDIRAETPPSTLSLSETLTFLNQNTPLRFSRIDERYITIVSPSTGTLCARILAEATGQPIANVTVSISNEVVTISDEAGLFYLPTTTEGRAIILSHIGYEAMTLSMVQLSNDCPIILLRPSISQLDEILLTQLFVKGINKETNGNFTINTSKFGLLPGQVDADVLQIIQSLPGVESINETVSNINIRGGTHDENLILWDDIKMYQSGHFFGLISAFNPEMTEKVIVHKNGTHPRYGESVSGVIAMYSKNEISDSLSGTAGINLINGSAFVALPLSNSFGIQLSGRHSINELVQTPVYTNYADRIFQNTEITNASNPQEDVMVDSDANFNFYDISTKLLWDASPKDRLRLNILTIDNSLSFLETITALSQSKESTLEQRSLVGGASWEHDWNSELTTAVMGYATYYLLNATNKDIFTTQEVFQENEVLETGVKLDATYRISEKIAIAGGYQFSETGIANTQDVNLPRFRSFVKDVLRNHAAFGTVTYTSRINKTVLTGGLRANYFEKFKKTLIEPRLHLHQQLGDAFSLDALGEFKSQATTQRIDFDSDFLGIEKRRWVLADDADIPIITSQQASFALAYKKNNWLLSAEAFYKEVEGITTANEGFQNQFQFVRSVGSYQAQGLEVVINKKMAHFSTWLSYLYMENNYTFSNLEPKEFPHNLDVRHTATLAGSYRKKGLQIALGVNWHSGRPVTSPSAEQQSPQDLNEPTINYDAPNGERVSDYLRADISGEYSWNLSPKVAAKVNVAILNLLDTKNTLNERYVLEIDDTGTSNINKVTETSLGLTPNFSLQVVF